MIEVIKLRFVNTKTLEPCSAIEDIAHLGKQPNSWMTKSEIALCREFSGTEHEAIALRNEIEKSCSASYHNWLNSL